MAAMTWRRSQADDDGDGIDDVHQADDDGDGIDDVHKLMTTAMTLTTFCS